MKADRLFALALAFVLTAGAEAAGAAGSTYPLETVVYKAIVASYLENPREVERYAASVARFDQALNARGAPASEAADNLAWLWAESLAGPPQRAAGYERVLSGTVDPRVEANLRTALSEDLLTQIRGTRRQDRGDRWGDMFNGIGHDLARFGNGQLAMGFNVVNDVIFFHRQFTKVTERMRKEWFLIDTALRRNPNGPQAAQLRERKQAIEAALKDDAVRRCVQVARGYAERGWWHTAWFYVHAAEEAGYTKQARFRRRVREAVATDERWKGQSLTVADTEPLLRTREQVEAYTRLLRALTAGDAPALSHALSADARTLAATPMADDTQDVVSILYEWAGDRRKALDVQRELALRHPDATGGQVAAARLADPYYNPRARLDQEQKNYRGRQRHFVLTGRRSAEQSVMLVSKAAETPLLQFGIGVVFIGIDVIVRTVIVSVGTPVSPAPILAAGEELLANPRNLLTPEEASDIRVRMGVFYSRVRRYEDAERSYQKARILSPSLKTNLEHKSADERLRRALETKDPNRQVLLLERLVQTTVDKDVAARANDALRQLRMETKVDFEIPYDWLVEDRQQWRGLGVAVAPELLDGSRANGEISDRGLVFWRDLPSSATFVLTDGRRKGYINLTPPRREALHAAAEMWVDRNAALEEGEMAVASRKVPLEIQGSAGSEGLLVYPTIKRAPLTKDDKRRFW